MLAYLVLGPETARTPAERGEYVDGGAGVAVQSTAKDLECCGGQLVDVTAVASGVGLEGLLELIQVAVVTLCVTIP